MSNHEVNETDISMPTVCMPCK